MRQKITTMTFRTSPNVKDEIERMAAVLNENKYNFHYTSYFRKCGTKSGLIHELLSGNVTLYQVRDQVKKIEQKKGGS